jgi:hypothetical protein
MCDRVASPLLGRGAGGRPPGFPLAASVGGLVKRERAMDMFAGPDRNRNITLVVAVVVIVVLAILYAAGSLPGL